MLNIITTDKVPQIEYSELIDRFLMNTLAFSLSLVNKDYSTFSKEALEIIAKEPEWLNESVEWSQSLIFTSLLNSENFESLEQLINEFNSLIKLYGKFTDKTISEEQEATFISLHDKFLALLLTDEALINDFLTI